MAKTPASNDVFMREVDEELRRDQMMAFGRRYGFLVIGLIVVALIALGGVLYWRYHREQVAAAQGVQYQQAVDALAQQNYKAAASGLSATADSSNDAYRALARFGQADALLSNDDRKGAAAKLASIANDEKVSKPLRDLALVRQTNVEFDTLKPQQVIDRLRPLATKGSPWLGSAGEMIAVAYLDSGKTDLARQMLGQIGNDQSVPDTIRQRAVQMENVLEASGGDAKPADQKAVDQNKDKAAK